MLASLGVVILIKLLGQLPAASRIKSIEFAKVKASLGDTEDVGLFFNDKASRRIFTNGRASRVKARQTQIFGEVHREQEKAVSLEDLRISGKICLMWVASATAGKFGREGEGY